MRSVMSALFAVVVGVVSFACTAAAAGTVSPSGGEIVDLLGPLREAFASGRYAYAGSIALVLVVAVARKYAVPRVPWLDSERGYAALVLLGSFGATLAVRLADPSALLTPSMAWDAATIAAGAAGGYALLKVFLAPPLRALADRYHWLAAPVGILLWVFESKARPRLANVVEFPKENP